MSDQDMCIVPKKQKSFVRKKKPNGQHYIDNEKFQKEMENYIEIYNNSIKNQQSPPKINNYLGSCFLKLSNKLSQSPSFRSYSFTDEMILDGLENCIRYAHKFDPNKISTFYSDKVRKVKAYSYFTTIIVNAFIRRIQEEEKNKYIKCKTYETNLLNLSLGNESVSDETNILQSSRMHDNISEFIEEYEKKIEIKKRKTAEANKLKPKKLLSVNTLSVYLENKIVGNTVSTRSF